MLPIVEDQVTWSVGRSVTVVSPAETAEPTAVGVEDLGAPKESCVKWIPRSPMGRGNLRGVGGWPIVKYREALP